jgi:uncharacterized membrane protein HdeD (DUF308 family)
MKVREKFENFEYRGTDWRRLMVRGSLMLLMGALLVLVTLSKPNVMLFSTRDSSWLPVAAFVVVTVGLMECFDAIFAKDVTNFFMNLQNGVLDVVVAILIIVSIGVDPVRLSLMISAFLMIKGIMRIIVAQMIHLPHKTSTLTGATVSFFMGFLIWLEWPSSGAWFLAVGLSTDIAFRGWTLIMLAYWVKNRKAQSSAV